MIKSGFCSVTFRRLGVDDIIALAIRNAADCIEWGGDIHVTEPETAAEVYRKMETAGLKTCAFGSYYNCSGNTEEMRKIVNIAKALHTENIRVWAGEKSPKLADKAYRNGIVENLRELCTIAEKDHLTISLEYHRKTLTENAESALRLIEEVNMPNLKSQWQINPDISPEENYREVKALAAGNGILGNIHVANMQTDNSFETLRDIRSDWQKYFRAISACEGDRTYILEFCKGNTEESFADDMSLLHELIKEGSV